MSRGAYGGGQPAGVPSDFKKFARMAVRYLYPGPCPPKEEGEPSARNKFAKVDTIGAACILVDCLCNLEWVKEDELAERLKLHPKHVRRCMRYLEQEGVVRREHRKETRRMLKTLGELPGQAAAPTAAAAGSQGGAEGGEGDEEETVRTKAFTFSWCTLDYARFYDTFHLRLASMRAVIRAELDDSRAEQQYACPAADCRAEFTSLDAANLGVNAAGEFCCEKCGTVLQQVFAGGGMGDDEDKRARRQWMRDMALRLEHYFRPVMELCERLRLVPPPDCGTLDDWRVSQRQMQLAEMGSPSRQRTGRSRASEGGDTFPSADSLQVHLDGGGDSAARARVAPAPLQPSWFTTNRGGAAAAGNGSDEEDKKDGKGADAKGADAQYDLQDYLSRVQRQLAGSARSGEPSPAKVSVKAERESPPELPPAKRPKLEHAAAADHDAAGAGTDEWEDAGVGGSGGAAASAELLPAGTPQDEDDDWEDA